ncbi:MAG: hypothetical protein IT324_32230 [Anaerolineae bacterium]|nr:hypothetical protein [Anaerolineae bacterium]
MTTKQTSDKAANSPAAQAPAKAPKRDSVRRGFLPITTNTFDRVFISIVVFIAINLIWMRFLEMPAPDGLLPFGLPLFIASIVWFVIAFLIIRYG